MPTYVYGCKQCGHEFEQFQKISDAPLQNCPRCDQASAERKLTATAFILKGVGWYSEGYASAGASGRSSRNPES